jgi:Zn-dependent protease with chaperone function
VSRRPGRTTLALAVPLVLFVLFGMARVTAPVSALGLIFDEPIGFGAAAAVTSLLGTVLLLIPRCELAIAGVMAGPSREPSDDERSRLRGLLEPLTARAGIDADRLILRIQEDSRTNASAGGGHLLFVTEGALSLADEELEAILAHELGHHRGLHPVLTAVVWWLRLPGAALAAAYGFLRRAVAALGQRLGFLGRLLSLPLLLLLVVWQVAVMWLFYVAELLAMRAARISEFEADGAAARWGYAEPLVNVYERLAQRESEPPSRLGRLLADHPPLAERIERLGGAGTIAGAAVP